MNELYPPESQKLDVIGHLEELRRRIWISLIVLVIASVSAFLKGDDLMRIAQKPAAAFVDEFIFITPTEVFTSYIKLSFVTGFFVSFPIILYQVWAFAAPAVNKDRKQNVAFWMLVAIVFLFAGILFSYFIALPAALKFLLNFGRGVAVPAITVSKYISFVSAFLLIGGVIFQIPIVMALLAEVGILKTSMLKGQRKYALLVILVVAAVITPTQDIVNMMVFALPMFLLYEGGILLARNIERRKERKHRKDM